MKLLSPITLILFITTAILFGGGCTITQEGVQNFEVPTEDILPPSRVVASYRQLNKAQRLDDNELQQQVGSKELIDLITGWSKMKAVYSDYGIPDRPAKARIAVIEMSTKQNAYGAYSNLRPKNLEAKNYLKIGVSGTVAEDKLLFVQDRFLVIVRDLANTPDPERRSMLINFGHATSDRIPRDITDITLVGYLPYDNRVPASEILDKDDPLGMGLFRSGGITAQYKIIDKSGPKETERSASVFMCDVKDKSTAKGALKRVRDSLEKEGKTEDVGVGEEGFTCTFRGNPGIVARRESTVFGAYGTYTEKELKALMANIDRRVKPYVAPKIKEAKEPDDAEKKKKEGKGQ